MRLQLHPHAIIPSSSRASIDRPILLSLSFSLSLSPFLLLSLSFSLFTSCFSLSFCQFLDIPRFFSHFFAQRFSLQSVRTHFSLFICELEVDSFAHVSRLYLRFICEDNCCARAFTWNCSLEFAYREGSVLLYLLIRAKMLYLCGS